MNIEEIDMVEAIKRSKDRLVGFQVADNNRMAPGMGHLPWIDILDTLASIMIVSFRLNFVRRWTEPRPTPIPTQLMSILKT